MTHNSLYAVMLLATTTWALILLWSGIHSHARIHPYLNLKREPSRVKSLRLLFPAVGWRRRKKAWLSTAHFHRCLQLLALASWNTKVCSCSRPWADPKEPKSVRHVCARALLLASKTQTWSSSSTTTSVSRLLLKSSRVILGLHGKNNGLYISDVIAHLGPYIVHQQQHHVKRPQDKKKPCSYSPTFLKHHKYQSTSEHINHLYVWFIKVSCCSSSSMTADNPWKFDSTHMTLDSDRIWT